MTPSALAELAPAVSALWLPLALAAGSLVSWLFTAAMRLRADRGDRLGALVRSMHEELERTNTTSWRFRDEIDRLREARYALEDQLATLRDQAIAARVMVHELQRQMGVPETPFPPLPHPVLAPARAPPPAP